MPTPKLSPDQEAEVCRLYATHSLRELAALFPLSVQAIAELLDRHKVPKRKRGCPSYSRRIYRPAA